jgi:hypothetical protein
MILNYCGQNYQIKGGLSLSLLFYQLENMIKYFVNIIIFINELLSKNREGK